MDYPGKISSKLPQVGTTIFTRMSTLAKEHNAVNLAQGFPDFDPHPELRSAVARAMEEGHNQYAPMAGWQPLREAIAAKLERSYGVQYDPETEITITAGATQAISTAIAATIREGDEVIIFTPAYDCYAPLVELYGGTPVFVRLQYPGYHIDWDQLKHMIGNRTRMIILNNPHNPTGAVFAEEDLEQLERIVHNSGILLLSDEVYEHIVFDGARHHSLASRPMLAERSMVVFSFGKTFHMTGWKVGYIIAPTNLMAEFRKVHQYHVFSVHTPQQVALAEFLRNGEHWNIAPMYQSRRDQFLELMSDTRFKAVKTSGSYFVLMDYSDITDEPDVDFARRLTVEHGVAAIPVSVFYNVPTDHHVLRFCFAKNEETLAKAAGLLGNV